MLYACIPGATHIQFCDYSVLCDTEIRRFDPAITLDGYRVSAATTDLLVHFFEKALYGIMPDLSPDAAKHQDILQIL